MNDTPKGLVSAVVVACGINDYWRECLRSLRGQSHAPLEIILIDNSRAHSLGAQAQKEFPGVTVLTTVYQATVGYGKALNQGIAVAQGEYILCLNDDVALNRFFVEKALAGFVHDQCNGTVSGKVMRQDAGYIDSCGIMLTPWRTCRERGYGARDKGQFEKEGPVFGATGAVAFYRRTMLEGIRDRGEYFDTRFGIFYEDLDIAWRAQRRGWKAWYIPGALAYHRRGASVRTNDGAGRPFARRYLSDALHVELLKNRYLTIRKNESAPGFLLHLPFILGYELFSWGYAACTRPALVPLFMRTWIGTYSPAGEQS